MSDVLTQVIDLFQQKFKPAQSSSDATDFLDTDEIHSAIAKIAPGVNISKEDVFEALKNAGYQFTAEPGKMNFNLKWMLIKQY